MILLGFQCLRPDTLKSQPFARALSLSDEYCDHLPETWCLDWTTPHYIPTDFTADQAAEITRECTASFGCHWQWPNLMTDAAWAHSFHERWASARGFGLFAIACARSDGQRIADATRPPEPQPGFAPMGALGIHLMAEAGRPVEARWRILGWEVLEADSRMIGDCHTDPAVADPSTGLLPTHDAALRLAESLQGRPGVSQGAHLVPVPIAIVAMEATCVPP